MSLASPRPCAPVLAGLALLLGLAATPLAAGEAVVEAVEATPQGDGNWRFAVTVRHADAGWDHYADKWQVQNLEGAVLGERELLHPHDDEQPFTRSLSGVAIAPGLNEVQVRAHDSVHGWGPAFSVTLSE